MITVPAGSTNVPVANTNDFTVGQKLLIGSGADLEVATVTAVGRPGIQTRLAAPAPAGATNLKALSTNNISVGDKIRLDIASAGRGIETVTVAAVGTAGAGGTGITLTAPLQFDHASNLPFNDAGTGVSFTPATAHAHSSNEPVQALGTGITLDRPLTHGHGVNAVVRDPAVTTAGYQGAKAPNQWFGGPALQQRREHGAARCGGPRLRQPQLRPARGPRAAEGYQAASGADANGCTVAAPARSGPLGRSAARVPDGADADSNCTDFRAANGTFTAPTPGQANFATTVQTSVNGDVSGTVPPTLSLILGTTASFGSFMPGVARTYTATTSANVVSTAGDAALSLSDPSANATGHLVNGTFSLKQPLLAQAFSAGGSGRAFAPVGGSADPTTLLSYGGPISNDAVRLNFQQAIGANDPLRTGSYANTLTYTLSTTNP